MSTSARTTALRTSLALVAVVIASPARAAPPASPNLGRPMTPADIAAVDITITPNGDGLPPGSGTARQGRALYQAQCLVCHGVDGASGPNLADRLVGGKGTLGTATPVRTIGSYWPYAPPVFDYIRRAMPYTKPKSLTDEQVYQLTAFVLFLNGLVAEDTVVNKETLSKVEMPNKGGFLSAWPGDQR